MIYLFHGENTYLIQEKLKIWKDKFTKKYGHDLNCSVIDAQPNSKAHEILNEALTLPFLAEKRLIIVKNFFECALKDEQNHFAKHLVQIPESTVLVFAESSKVDSKSSLLKKLAEIGEIEEFSNLNPFALSKWVEQKAKKNGSLIKKSDIDYLIQNSGPNLWHLNNEINKLSLYCQNRPITKNDIDLLTSSETETSIFKLTDLIGQKNITHALTTMKQLMDKGSDPDFIFHMILRQFRYIIQILELLIQNTPPSQIATKLNLKAFIVSTLSKQTKNFSMPKLISIYRELLKIEISRKTGKIKYSSGDTNEFNLALEKFILESCT